MNQSKLFMRNLFDDMVERRLWPVAAILVVALIAIPVLLAKPASKADAPLPTASATPAVGGASSPLPAFKPVVSTAETSAQRKGLRGRANPFLTKGIDFTAATAAGNAAPIAGVGDATVSTGETAKGAGDATPQQTSGGQTQGGSGTGTTGTTKFYTYTADVKFGQEGDTKKLTLSQFRALPNTDDPVVIFMGVKRDGKTAVFLLSSSTTTTGDGKCEPTDSTCTFLYMTKGGSQIIESVTADGEIVTYELELVGIDAKPTSGPEKAGASRKAKNSRKAHTSRKAAHKRKAARRAARAHQRRTLRAFGRLPF